MREETGTSVQAEVCAWKDIAGQYLTFELGEEPYGLQILKVQEIIGMTSVTRVPRMPDFVRGVINLRGKVIPVIDLRSRFSLESQEQTERTCIIVVQIGASGHQVTLGIIVDQVSEVVDIGPDQIEPSPDFGTNVDTTFILGMGKVGERVIMLLDLDRVLSGDELSLVRQSAGDVSD